METDAPEGDADPDAVDGEEQADGKLTEDRARDLIEMDGLEGLGPLADKLQSRPLKPVAVAGLTEAIDELAGGDTEAYVNTSGHGIDRIAVVTDEQTVRLLMLTGSWKWRGPYMPEDPHDWAEDRGYIPAPEVNDE